MPVELIPLAETAALPTDLPTPNAASTLRVLADGALSIGFVAAVYRIGRRAVMGYYLPDDLSDVDLSRTTTERDPRALALTAVAYVVGVALTAGAVALLASVAWALAWAGVLALVAAAIALRAARDDAPLDDVRTLVEARRHDAE